jgi:hypothetical protein
MLLSLTAPSQIASDTMKKYGISVYDAQGKFIGFNGVAEQLHTKLGKLDQAQRNAALGHDLRQRADHDRDRPHEGRRGGRRQVDEVGQRAGLRD